jgi:hypothetical protein
VENCDNRDEGCTSVEPSSSFSLKSATFTLQDELGVLLATQKVHHLVVCTISAEFAAVWRANDIEEGGTLLSNGLQYIEI